ncbi:MAG: hypothetical protein WD607_08315 [Candidatus Paceibacterota bacterium]
MYKRENLLFIQGPEKTATSSLNGMLNAHPDILNLFEVYMNQSYITKYSSQLLDAFPEARRFFSENDDFGIPYLNFFNWLKEKDGIKYSYVGTKINSLDPHFIQPGHNYKTIFTVRDIHSWLLKQSVIQRYRTDLDIVVPSIEYLKFLVSIQLNENSIMLKMEDIVLRQEDVYDKLSDFLKVSFDGYTDNWWENFGKNDNDKIKNVFRLGHVHHSSHIEPKSLDTEYKLSDHPIWNDIEPIFNKYYNQNQNLTKPEINRDLKGLEKLYLYSTVQINTCYDFYLSRRFGNKKSEDLEYCKKRKFTDLKIISKFIGVIDKLKFKLAKYVKILNVFFLYHDEIGLG